MGINNLIKNKVLLIFFVVTYNTGFAKLFISNKPWGGLGDNIMSFAIAKAISMHYNLEFYYSKFRYSDLFLFDCAEKKITYDVEGAQEVSFVNPLNYADHANEYDNMLGNYLLYTYCLTPCGAHVSEKIFNEIKKLIKFKQKIDVNIIPQDRVSLAVHIRKGNGGGENYDGELTSLQLFDFDRSMVRYHNVNTYPFESLEEQYTCINSSKWTMDTGYTLLSLKFPPEQYYVDQIIKISQDLNNQNIAVLIVTDDRDPFSLISRIKQSINKSNITYHYVDNRLKDHSTRIVEDLYNLSLCDGLIRSQSNFAKIAELMGNHKFIFFTGNHKWVDGKMIITDVAVKKYDNFLNGALPSYSLRS